MRFSLTAEQRALQDSVRRALEQLSPLERVRRFADGGEDQADDVQGGLAALGAAGLLVPEAHGGLGLTLLEAALAQEAIGYAVAPSAFVGSTLAVVALAAGGDADLQAKWLPKLASGEAKAGAALSEAFAGARDGGGVRAEGGKLSGKALNAMTSRAADLLLVADAGGRLHLVEGSAGLTLTPMPTIDRTRTTFEVGFDGAAATGLDPAATQRVRDAAYVLLAADMLGASQAMLDKAVAYAGQREQFGRLIGSFQAVKHLCAEMAAQLEPCRALVWYAAYAFDAAPEEASVTAAHAKAHLSEVSRFVARTATEVHGGIGITDLLGLHYWFKRVGFDRQYLGGPEHVRAHAARLQGLAA